MTDLKKIAEEINVDRAMADVEYMCNVIGERRSGKASEKEMCDYLEKFYKEEGIPYKIYELPGFVCEGYSGSVQITSPELREIPCSVFAQAVGTPPEGIEAELVYLGPGGVDDYTEDIDVKGKIVLTELSYKPPRPEKVRLAQMHGAIGVLMCNWGLPEQGTLPYGTVKPMWGNPSDKSDLEKLAKIPVLGIKRLDGKILTDMCAKGPVKIKMTVDAKAFWTTIRLPIAKLEGNGPEKDEFVIVGGHYDCWRKGASCNASGNAANMEICRVLNKHKNELNRSIWFTFWPGHETGVMDGSTWFVDNFWDELNKDAIAYINLDSMGMAESSIYKVEAATEATSFHQKIDKIILGKEGVHLPARKIGDHSFYGIGIPTIYGKTHYTEEQLKLWMGANLGWYYHSDEDLPDKVQPDVYELAMHTNVAYAYELATCKALPFEYSANCDELMKRYKELDDMAGDHIDFKTGINAINRFKPLAEKLRELQDADLNEKQTLALNKATLKFSRILLPITNSVAGKYGQDTYGLTALSTRFPGLFEVKNLVELEKGSDDYNILLTKLVRERNKSVDVINDVIELAESTLEKIEMYK